MRHGLILQHVLISTNKSVLWCPRREEVLAFSAQLFMGRRAECAGGSLSARETLAGRCGLSAERRHRITTHFLLLFTSLLFVCRMRNIYMSLDQICFPHVAPSFWFVFYSSSSSSSPPLSSQPLQTLHALSKVCALVLEYFWLNLITLSEWFTYHLHNAVYYLGGRTLAFVCQHCRKGVVICLWWREMGKLEMT